MAVSVLCGSPCVSTPILITGAGSERACVVWSEVLSAFVVSYVLDDMAGIGGESGRCLLAVMIGM